MKKTVLMQLTGLVLLTTGCNNNSYNSLRNAEDRLIANYINRNELVILTEEPAIDHVWAEKEYYQVKGYDNFYFHLIERGDSIYVDSISPTRIDTMDLTIMSNDVIVARYKQFTLTENADTLSYWTTLDQAYPFEFHFGNTSECESVAWHVAVRLMKYPDSQCEIIVPSKLGFSNEQSSVTPYVYIIKIKVKQ